jgi:hypothetical protein
VVTGVRAGDGAAGSDAEARWRSVLPAASVATDARMSFCDERGRGVQGCGHGLAAQSAVQLGAGDEIVACRLDQAAGCGDFILLGPQKIEWSEQHELILLQAECEHAPLQGDDDDTVMVDEVARADQPVEQRAQLGPRVDGELRHLVFVLLECRHGAGA